MSQRPSFIVVTITVTLLVLIGFGAKLLAPLIPPPKPNRLIGESADYLIQGATEAVDWRVYDDSAFIDARRLDKPILLVIGSPWSKLGRDVDRDAFSYGEVQNYLNRNFICVRIDSFERPDWMNAFFPVTRLQFGFLPGLQIWALDTHGRVFDFIGKTHATESLDHTNFLTFLVRIRAKFDQIRNADANLDFLDQQSRDIGAIENTTGGTPDFATFNSILVAQGDRKYGGFPKNGYQTLMPNAWRYELITGDDGETLASMKAMEHSPIVDLLDGGFFRFSEALNWRMVHYDKVAVQNAEMMEVCALAGKLAGDHLGRYLAERTFASLTSEFVQNGLIGGCRVGDEGPLNRSARSSFSPRKLRAIFPDGSNRGWVVDHLGLEVESNPQMTPYLASAEDPFQEPDRFNGVLDKLRAYSSGAPLHFAGLGMLDVNGFVIARLIETARLWRDSERLQTALDLYDRLERFRTRDDVVHGLDPKDTNLAFLSDYLAYADASLQAYLATGRVVCFENGLAVLKRARFLYMGNAPGEFTMGKGNESSLTPKQTRAPEIVDNLCESCTARMIRLCHDYGRLLLELPGGSKSRHDTGLALVQTANACVARFAPIVDFSPQDATKVAVSEVSGFFCAAAGIQDDGYAIAVGPEAQEEADALYALLPFRLVAPAFGSIRGDMQRKSPGIYVLRGNKVDGPLTVTEAAENLGAALKVGG